MSTVFTYWPDGSERSRDNDPATATIRETSRAYDRNGQVTSITDGVKTLSYGARDMTGVPLEVTGFDGRLATYTYDRNGNMLSRVFADKRTDYTYDTASDLMTQIAVGPTNTAAARELSATYTYDDNGRMVTTTRGGATPSTTTNTYNATGQLTGIVTMRGAQVLQNQQYRYDASGNARRIADELLLTGSAATTSRVRQYTYSPANQLASDQVGPGGRREYAYDTHGRLMSVNAAAPGTDTEIYSYNAAHPGQQATRTVVAGGTTTIDTNTYVGGNLTKTATAVNGAASGSGTNSYDAMNRLTGSANTLPGAAASNAVSYDPVDRRVADSTSVGGAAATNLDYLYDGESPDAIAEKNTDTARQPANRWMATDPIGNSLGEVRDTNARYSLTDNIGSVVGMTNDAAQVQATFDNDAYGEPEPIRLVSARTTPRARGGASVEAVFGAHALPIQGKLRDRVRRLALPALDREISNLLLTRQPAVLLHERGALRIDLARAT